MQGWEIAMWEKFFIQSDASMWINELPQKHAASEDPEKAFFCLISATKLNKVVKEMKSLK